MQPDYAPELLCANSRLSGYPVAIIANRRGFLKSSAGPRIGGIVYTESARKVEYFVETLALIGIVIIVASLLSGALERSGLPLVAVFLGLGAALGPWT